MQLQAYRAAQDQTETARQTEYRLFAAVTRSLMDAAQDPARGLLGAIDWNRRLWITLQTDLAADENRLPDSLRAQLISISIWVDKHSRKVARGEADIQPLIDVNRSVMEGLAVRP